MPSRPTAGDILSPVKAEQRRRRNKASNSSLGSESPILLPSQTKISDLDKDERAKY